MLKQRIITALVLLAILLPALFRADPAAFLALALVLIAAGAWEWARLMGCAGYLAVLYGFACAVLCAVVWLCGGVTQPLRLLWVAAGSLWVLAGAWVLHKGVSAWAGYHRGLRLLAGLVILTLAWLGVAQARHVGIRFLLSILALVWVADIFAYFAGRAWGGKWVHQKLAPAISPGKSWEGVCGGMLGVVLLALVWCWVDAHYAVSEPSLYTRLATRGTGLMLLSVVFLAGASVMGDLLESLIKRSAGVKDSSGLLPGHGGILDRVDALLPALPLAMMVYTLVPA